MRSYVETVTNSGEEMTDLESMNMATIGVNGRINNRVINALEEQFGLGNN